MHTVVIIYKETVSGSYHQNKISLSLGRVSLYPYLQLKPFMKPYSGICF